MNTGSMNIASTAVSALNAFGVGMSATAHNIANVNTAAFQPVRVTYETGYSGYGVDARVIQPSGPPFVPPAESPIPPAGTSFIPPEMLHPSGTDLAREFVSMIGTQRAYEANAVSIRTWDQMTGTLLDMKV